MNCRSILLLKTCVIISATFLPFYIVIGVYYDEAVVNYDLLDNAKRQTIYDEWRMIAAHPWLASNHSSTVLFAKLYNDLDGLLIFMSNKTGKIALLRLSYPWQMMLQNQIYTLARFGQVYNYIVMVGDERSLAACLALNLPCYNGTKYYTQYYKEVDPTVDALYSDKKHYQPMVWFKLRFYRDVLIKDYTILACDTDIAFSRKNIWLSLERYSQAVGNCDMIFMHEEPVNTGFFYSRPNPSTLTLFNRWIHSERINWHLDDQQSFSTLRGFYYELCNTRDKCDILKKRKMIAIEDNSTDPVQVDIVTIRTFPSAYYRYAGTVCPVRIRMDPCLSTTAFVHTVCTVGQPMKVRTMKMNGFWLLEERCQKNSIPFTMGNNNLTKLNINKCEPLLFNNPNAEKRFLYCNDELAWTE